MPTIRSRCVAVRLGAEPEEALVALLVHKGAAEQAARLAVRLADGAPVLAEELCTQSHIAFVPQAIKLFYDAVTSPLPPYTAAGELLNAVVAIAEEKRSPTEEKRQTARHCLRIMEALAHDMLRIRLGVGARTFPEEAQKLGKTAQRFTIRQIQDMIDLILSAQVRILAAHPSLTIDSLVTGLGGISCK